MSDKNASRHWIQKMLPYAALTLLAICLLGFNHVLELRAEEGRRALVTFEMMEHDNMIVPYQYGHLYYNKPPLFNWVIAAFFGLFDSISEAALRLPGALSLLVTAWLLYYIGKRYLTKEVALMSAAFSLTLADMLFYGSINAGEIDLFYSLVVVAQMISIFWFFQRKQWALLFFVSYALTTIGLLTKGLPSLAFQGLTLLAYFTYKRSFRKLFAWQHFVAVALMLSATSAYFLAYAEYGDAISYAVNIFKQASQRSANESSFLKTVSQLLEFPPMFLSKLLPWSLALLFLFFKPIRQALAKNEWTLFLVIFTIANIPIYWTAPDLRIRYTYMFFPLLSVLFAQLLFFGIEQKPSISKMLLTFFKVITLIVGLGLIVLAFLNLGLPAVHRAYLMIIGSIILVIGWWFWKSEVSFHSYWWLILVLGFARLGYNLVGLPYTNSQRYEFRATVSKMIETAENTPIHYYDQLMVLEPSISLLGTDYYRAELEMPVDQTSSFAYYYGLYTGNVMTIDTVLTSGDYYVLFSTDMNEQLVPLDTFEKMIGGSTMYFCRAK